MDNNENIHNRFDTNEYKGKEQSRLAVTKTYLENNLRNNHFVQKKKQYISLQ